MDVGWVSPFALSLFAYKRAPAVPGISWREAAKTYEDQMELSLNQRR